jgi:hypothetical protein
VDGYEAFGRATGGVACPFPVCRKVTRASSAVSMLSYRRHQVLLHI